MRPNRLRSERQNQYNYMNKEEYENELKAQVMAKRQQQMEEKLQNQQEILDHYKNYQIGGDEPQEHYLNDLNSLLKNKESQIDQQRDLLNQYQSAQVIKPNFHFQQQQNQAFNGDLNLNSEPPNSNLNAFPETRRGAPNLFDDNFINKHNPAINQNNNENLNIINSIFGNENPGQLYGPQSNQDQESERMRRLKLRDQERQKRLVGNDGGGYGFEGAAGGSIEINPPVPGQPKTNLFGEAVNDNMRDLIWQQKRAQRMQSAGSSDILPTQITSAFEQHKVPMFQNQDMQFQSANEPGGSPESNLRASRKNFIIAEARNLDQSLHHEVHPTPSQEKKIVADVGILPGGSDLQQKRRDNERKMRQQEYQEYLAQQNKGKEVAPSSVPPRNPQSAQSHGRPQQQNIQQIQEHYAPASRADSHSVQGSQNFSGQQMSSLAQIGARQLQNESKEDKLRKQREYREFLDQQNQAKMQPQVFDQDRRKKQMVDEVFNQVMSVNSDAIETQFAPYEQPRRGQSAHLGHRNIPDPSQQPMEQARQPENDFFFAQRDSDSNKKRLEHERKREYAAELQQQIALKSGLQSDNQQLRRRNTTQGNDVPPQMVGHMQKNIAPNFSPGPQQVFPQDQFQMPPPSISSYGQFQPASHIGGHPLQPQLPQSNMMMPNDYMHQPGPSNYGYNPSDPGPGMMPLQFQQNPSYGAPQMFQPPGNPDQYSMPGAPPSGGIPMSQGHFPGVSEQSHSSDNRNQRALQQEEYRRQLNEQLKMKEDQKKQAEYERVQYEQKNDMDMAQVMAQQKSGLPQAPSQNYIRVPTDVVKSKITGNSDPEEERRKQMKQQILNEELSKQIEDKKQLKAEEVKAERRREQVEEQRLEDERQRLIRKQKDEVSEEQRKKHEAEGGSSDVFNDYVSKEKPRSVRRDQFETSAENNTVRGERPQAEPSPRHEMPGFQPSYQPSVKAMEIQPMNDFQKPELPLSNRREDLFGGNFGAQNSENQSSNFAGFQPQPQMHGTPQHAKPFEYQPQVPQQQQFSDMSYQPRGQTPVSSNFGQLQSQMSNPMNNYGPQSQQIVEQQQNMIVMYQQALQQIMELKHSFAEEQLKMREKLVQEREQLLEYEKIKAQQAQEMNQLQNAYQYLGGIRDSVSKDPGTVLPQNFKSTINNLLLQQKESLHHQQQDIQKFQQVKTKYPDQFIKNDAAPSNHNFENRGVDILEQSLSSDAKLVFVPAGMPPELGLGLLQQKELVPQDPALYATWNHESSKMDQTNFQKSLSGVSQLMPNVNNTPPKSNLPPKLIGSRPPTSQLPPTIPELPQLENGEDNEASSRHIHRGSDLDLNNRDFSQTINQADNEETKQETESSQQRQLDSYPLQVQENYSLTQHKITDTNPLVNTQTIQENLNQIETILTHGVPKTPVVGDQNKKYQIHQNIMPQQEVKSQFVASQSDFYNKTYTSQQQHEASQLEELQKQMLRIMGNTNGTELADQLIDAVSKPEDQQRFEQQNQHQLETFAPPETQPSQMEATENNFGSIQQTLTNNNFTGINPLIQATINEQQMHIGAGNGTLEAQDDEWIHSTFKGQSQQEQTLQTQGMNTLAYEQLLRASNINIADSITEKNETKFHKVAQNVQNKPPINLMNTKTSEVQPGMFSDEPVQQFDYQPNSQFEEPVEVQLTKPRFSKSNTQGTDEDLDVWNDPDLIPPPFVDGSNEEEDDYSPQQDFSQIRLPNLEVSGLIGGTIDNLGAFSPPSGEKFFIGVYDEEVDAEEVQNSDYIPYSAMISRMEPEKAHLGAFQGQHDNGDKPFQFSSYNKNSSSNPLDYDVQNEEEKELQYNRSQHSIPYEDPNDKSVTKKEKDMLEVAKLIQKATETTNSLFENSEQFKFRIRSESKQSQRVKKATNDQIGDNESQGQLESSRLNKKTLKTAADVFKQGDVQQQKQCPDDDPILSNLDRMIDDLQAQRSSNQEPRPGSHYDQQRQQTSKFLVKDSDIQQFGGKPFRPISAKDGNYLNAAKNANIAGPSKIGQGVSNYQKDVRSQMQKSNSILRPLSGKSNSQRYSGINLANSIPNQDDDDEDEPDGVPEIV